MLLIKLGMGFVCAVLMEVEFVRSELLLNGIKSKKFGYKKRAFL